MLDKLLDQLAPQDGMPVLFKPMNPLCDSAERGDLPMITQLVSTGTDVNTTGENGNSALAFACANGHADCTALLVRMGANPNQPSTLGNGPLHAACWADSTKCIRILVDAKADVDMKSFSGATALHVAIQGAREAALGALLAHGASRTVKDGNGKTPLQLALSLGHTECERVLRQSAAEEEARERRRLDVEREAAEKRANAAADALLAELELEGGGSAGGGEKGSKPSKRAGKRAAQKAAKAAAAAQEAPSAAPPRGPPLPLPPLRGHVVGGDDDLSAIDDQAAVPAVDDQASDDALMANALLGLSAGGRSARGKRGACGGGLPRPAASAQGGGSSLVEVVTADAALAKDPADSALARARTVERCPHCGSRARPTAANRCPSCSRNVLEKSDAPCGTPSLETFGSLGEAHKMGNITIVKLKK